MKRKVCVLLAAWMLIGAILLAGCGADAQDIENLRDKTAAYLLEQTPNPGAADAGGDWSVYGIANSGLAADDSYFENYRENISAQIKANGGVIDDGRATTYARVAIALNACGYDVYDVEGYNLLAPEDDIELVSAQPMNGQSFALISANQCGYELENEQVYIDYLLAAIDEGLLDMGLSAADYYAFFVQALSYYQGDAAVDAAIETCLQALAQLQTEDGSYGSAAATSQVIIALCMIDCDPYAFKAGENNVVDGLLLYALEDGSFCHLQDGETNQLSTEQALEALDALADYRAAHAEQEK